MAARNRVTLTRLTPGEGRGRVLGSSGQVQVVWGWGGWEGCNGGSLSTEPAFLVDFRRRRRAARPVGVAHSRELESVQCRGIQISDQKPVASSRLQTPTFACVHPLPGTRL